MGYETALGANVPARCARAIKIYVDRYRSHKQSWRKRNDVYGEPPLLYRTSRGSVLKVTYKRISGFPKYFISDQGDIFRYDGYKIKPRPDKDGYLIVNLMNVNQRTLKVHRLVAKHFCEGRHQMVCHLNHDTKDNRASNLMWGDHKENMRQMILANRHLVGSRAPGSKLKEWQVSLTRGLFQFKGQSRKLVAKNLGVSVATIDLILTYKTWKHVKPSISELIYE